MMSGFGMGFGGFGFLLMVLFWGGVLVAVFWMVGNLFPKSNSDHQPARPPESADEIVKRRYARGEISKEEFEVMRHNLARSTTTRTEA